MRTDLCLKRVFQIGVESFFRIELRTVAGQIEQLDLVFTLLEPRLDRLALMDSQVVENQKHFLARVLNQCL